MDFNIRQEQIKDYEAVHKVVELYELLHSLLSVLV